MLLLVVFWKEFNNSHNYINNNNNNNNNICATTTNMCIQKTSNCYCCWKVMSRCWIYKCDPFEVVCTICKIVPTEVWWTRCNNCLGICPLFGTCTNYEKEPISKKAYFVSRSRNVALEQQFYPGHYGEFKSNPKYCTQIGALAIEETDTTDIYQLKWKRKWKFGKFGTKSCVLIKGNENEF